MIMNSSYRQLLHTLKQKNDWISANELSALLGKSPRSIRYAVSQINGDNTIIESSTKGYRLTSNYTPFVDDISIPETSNDRIQYIVEKIIIHHDSLDMDNLCDYFCISDSTLKNEIQQLKKTVEPLNIHIKTKNNQLFAIAKDRDRQSFALKVVKDELKNNSFSLENVQRFFNKVDLDAIKQIVFGILTKHEYYIDEYSLTTYIIHLALCIENHKTGTGETTDFYRNIISSNNDDVVIMIVSEVFEELSKYYKDSKFTKEDIFEASMLMTTRIINRSKTEDDDLETLVGKETADLIMEIIHKVNNVYSINLNDARYIYRFAVHIKNALVRARSQMTINEAQILNLKEEYPFMYQVARYISYIVNDRIGLVLNTNEISYITLHVGVLIEEATMKNEKINCLVVANDYYVIGKNLCNRLSSSLSDLLTIDSLVTNADDIDKYIDNIDIILSTYKINNDELPVINIGPFPNANEIEKLRQSISSQLNIKKKKNLSVNLKRFVKDELVYPNTNFSSPADAINALCDDLYSKGLILDTFKDELFAHESIAISSYNNVAIAHSLNNSDISSFVAVAINNKPILWGDNNVSLILVISLKDEDRKEFKEIFHFFTSVISNGKIFSKLANIKSVDDLIDAIYENI